MKDIERQLRMELDAATTADDVEALRVRYLGRKGILANFNKDVRFDQMAAEERREFGRSFNELKLSAEQAIAARLTTLGESCAGTTKNIPPIDLTMPAADHRLGSLHPITLVRMELERLFHGMGFMVDTGQEVETEYYNFDALNIPSDHPAREMQDTYWLTNGDLLRTHTSATQVRALLRYGAPIRAIFPGRCFRYEELDASHENTFYQLEGLMVDEGVTVATLIGVMKSLLSEVFHKEVRVRLRPGFFPFVEPGFELDLECVLCEGVGCPTCRTGWIELIPCGIVHPAVLAHGGIDPDRFSGFAFGLGLTRLAMMKYAIPDIRLLNAGDLRFNRQFPAIPERVPSE